MKYKLKFEITFPDMEKDDERDAKIVLLNSDIVTEVESESPINVPSENSIVILGDVEYGVVVIRHKLDKDFYTTICYVANAEYLLRKREKSQEMYNQKRMSGIAKLLRS